MNDRRVGAIHYGYGRMWAEPKAKGRERLFQLLREPATKTSAPLMFVGTLALYALAMSAAYAIVQVNDWSSEIKTTNTKVQEQIPVSELRRQQYGIPS